MLAFTEGKKIKTCQTMQANLKPAPEPGPTSRLTVMGMHNKVCDIALWTCFSCWAAIPSLVHNTSEHAPPTPPSPLPPYLKQSLAVWLTAQNQNNKRRDENSWTKKPKWENAGSSPHLTSLLVKTRPAASQTFVYHNPGEQYSAALCWLCAVRIASALHSSRYHTSVISGAELSLPYVDAPHPFL